MTKYLLFVLFLLPVSVLAQDRGDKKIIVTVTDTSNVLNRISLMLYERGYDIHTKDQAVGFISTEVQELDIAWLLKARFLIRGNQILITGSAALRPSDARIPDFDAIEYRGGGFGNKAAWEELERMGKLFGKVTYSK